MATVTVVIPNYKGIKFLDECLSSLYAQEAGTPEFEVLVVDNASGDGSVELIKERFPQTRLICLEENTGFCHGVNVGIEASEAPYVLLLNNDTKVYPDFIRRLVDALEGDPGAFAVSSAMLMWDRPELMDDAGDQYCVFGWAYGRGKGKPLEKYNRPAKIFSACGGAALYRRSVFQEIGLFDENHFAYLEDLDIGYRADIYGYHNLYEPAARVVHYGSASTGSRYNEWKTRRAAANSVYVISKNMPLLQKILNAPFLFLGFFVKYLFFLRKKMGKLYLQGLVDGFKMSFGEAGKRNKVRFCRKHLGAYVKIQLYLYANAVKILMKS